MKKYKDLSLKVKVPLTLGLASFAVFALVCILLMIPMRKTALEDSARFAQYSANACSETLAGKINGVASVIRAYSGLIENIITSSSIADEHNREYIVADLVGILQREKSVTNIFCLFEPNAVDGLDSLFKGRAGSSADGRFIPYLTPGRISTASLDVIGSALYETPKSTGREIISEPYTVIENGVETNIFSVSIPIMVNGNFVGVIGSRFYIDELSRLISSINNYGDGKLVTDKGIIAIYHVPDRIGVLAERGNREILDRLPEGKMFEGFYYLDGQRQYKVYVPISLGEGNRPWFFAIDIPSKDVYKKSVETVKSLVLYCVIGIIMITLAGWLLMSGILKNVLNITGIIKKLSLGLINSVEIEKEQNKDEVGEMKKELSIFINGLKDTASFAHDIGDGNLNAEYHMLSDGDVLGNSLLGMRESLQKAQKEQDIRAKEEEQRNWGTAGLAKFAEILRRDNTNMEALSYNVVSNLVKYLDANQGGIFVLNESETEDDKFLELKACYAFDRKKFDEKQIRLGEGLVGTCYLEGESIYLTKVPDDYINITSGLGDANPSAVLISPLKVNDQIFGVLELASFKPFEPFQLDFVQKVSESIAATISSVRVNIRTERLLAQSKIQAEEMINHEEELRQTMEEMHATQEEMRRRETELHDTLENMKVHNEEEMRRHDEEALCREYVSNQFNKHLMEIFDCFEFTSDSRMTSVSASVLAMTGLTEGHFIGRTYAETYPGGEMEGSEIWSRVINGERVTSHTKLGDNPVKVVTVPLVNKQDRLEKVVVFVLS